MAEKDIILIVDDDAAKLAEMAGVIERYLAAKDIKGIEVRAMPTPAGVVTQYTNFLQNHGNRVAGIISDVYLGEGGDDMLKATTSTLGRTIHDSIRSGPYATDLETIPILLRSGFHALKLDPPSYYLMAGGAKEQEELLEFVDRVVATLRAPIATNSGKNVILIVDNEDNALMANAENAQAVIDATLALQDFRVIEFKDADDYLKMLEQNPASVAAILSDVGLSGSSGGRKDSKEMDGAEIAAKIRDGEFGPEIQGVPIILVSALNRDVKLVRDVEQLDKVAGPLVRIGKLFELLGHKIPEQELKKLLYLEGPEESAAQKKKRDYYAGNVVNMLKKLGDNLLEFENVDFGRVPPPEGFFSQGYAISKDDALKDLLKQYEVRFQTIELTLKAALDDIGPTPELFVEIWKTLLENKGAGQSLADERGSWRYAAMYGDFFNRVERACQEYLNEDPNKSGIELMLKDAIGKDLYDLHYGRKR